MHSRNPKVFILVGLFVASAAGVSFAKPDTVDGQSVNPSECMTYKGMMYSGIPNLASSFGYTNASWTLKCDLTCAYVCRLLNHMESKGYGQCMPVLNDPTVTETDWIDFSSGYIRRSIDKFPKQGSKTPWKVMDDTMRPGSGIWPRDRCPSRVRTRSSLAQCE